MIQVTKVEARPDHRLWLRFNDGTEGEADLSALLTRGVLRALLDPQRFAEVQIGEDGEIRWPSGIDLCPDALYLQVTGKQPEDIFPRLRATGAASNA